MTLALLALVVLACTVPVLALTVMDRRPFFAALIGVLMFWCGFLVVVEAARGCYPWSACAEQKERKAGPE